MELMGPSRISVPPEITSLVLTSLTYPCKWHQHGSPSVLEACRPSWPHTSSRNHHHQVLVLQVHSRPSSPPRSYFSSFQFSLLPLIILKLQIRYPRAHPANHRLSFPHLVSRFQTSPQAAAPSSSAKTSALCPHPLSCSISPQHEANLTISYKIRV